MELIARDAGCAKGLVHYHFRTKSRLMSAAAEHIWANRISAWKTALAATDAREALGGAWTLLTSEATGGIASACASLSLECSDEVGQTVRKLAQEFVANLALSLSGLLARTGLRPSVPLREIAALLAAVIDGLGLQISSGTSPDSLEPAWAAFWAGMLSLTERG